jgi:hypothetical protein
VNLLKTPFRRTTAVLAGAFIGLAGAAALATPASAHTATAYGTASCADQKTGTWKVDWTVRNGWNLGAQITGINAAPQKGSVTGKIADQANWLAAGTGTATGVQTLSKQDGSARITVRLTWTDKRTSEAQSRPVTAPRNCGKDHKPPTKTPCPTPSASTSPTPKPTPSTSTSATPTPSTTVSPTPSATTPAPAPGGGGASGGGLPVTGAAAGSIAGGAALLLAIGGVLFVMARRRKVKFTA